MKNNNCKISVIIPVFNNLQYIKKSIDSVINQSYKNLETTLIEENDIVILIRKKIEIKDITYKDVFVDMKSIFDKAKIVKKEEEKI